MSKRELLKKALARKDVMDAPKECFLDRSSASLRMSNSEFHVTMTNLGFHLPALALED